MDTEKKIEILKKIKCFILDMDGTIYLGDNLFPFTPEFLKTAKEKNKDFRFFTNNSSKNSKMYGDKLKKMGIELSHEVMISNEVIIDYIKKNYKNPRAFVLGTPALIEDFKNSGIEIDEQTPNIAVLGFDTTLEYNRLSKFCTFVRNGVDYFGVNLDLNCPVENGGFIPDCGSMAKLVEASTKRYPEFFGKPSRHTVDYIVNKTGYKQSELMFIGDRLYTDIAIAEGTEAYSALVLSGEATLFDLEKSEYKPNFVIESLKELTELLKQM